MPEISTHTITTKVSKKKVVLKDWITGADDERIQAHYYEGATTNPTTGQISYKAGTMQEADHEAISIVVLSVDGNSEDIVNQVLELPVTDTKQIVAEVKKITNPLVENE